ncbi:DUF4399 domain-containing protein [Zobellella aerophila]|uniref:DUF4399 domain-containing protein n=1 Tax=Zobellella aerophila TaxID=870480 RepID=A0ABP6WCZ1_9GAMM
MKNWIAGLLLLSPLALATSSPEGAKAYIISPADGEQVAQEFTVRFGLAGMGVAPAGVEKANTGHHHLLINAGELPDMSTPMPASERLLHFGGGQTEAQLTLPPGDYTLQLVLGDHLHVPLQPPVVSEQIRVTVK